MLRSLFTEHPASVGETYFEHLVQALRFSTRMFVGSVACLVHAVFPFLCVKTGSRYITELHERMVTNRDRRHAARGADARTHAAGDSSALADA